MKRGEEGSGGGKLEALAAELDRFALVPDGVLLDIVSREGGCRWLVGDEPVWLSGADSDAELAERLCAECPERLACLEWDLRTGGPNVVGVCGGLAEDERRALHVVWAARREGRAS
ncbi:hypothetical protein APASM_1247 [Actinosynnema pretiosum subsp. pretiosum]|nr:hypothetical protein APASM_1247 [Actinosynnema pretiosum subsp. pretiosum]